MSVSVFAEKYYDIVKDSSIFSFHFAFVFVVLSIITSGIAGICMIVEVSKRSSYSSIWKVRYIKQNGWLYQNDMCINRIMLYREGPNEYVPCKSWTKFRICISIFLTIYVTELSWCFLCMFESVISFINCILMFVFIFLLIYTCGYNKTYFLLLYVMFEFSKIDGLGDYKKRTYIVSVELQILSMEGDGGLKFWNISCLFTF